MSACNRGNRCVIAIIIVTYRSAKLTIDALQSLAAELESTKLNMHAIVVDNASGDFTAIANAIAANRWSAWATVIQAPHNGGFAYGNNLGIAHAFDTFCPDYIYLLNPDTQVRRGAISALARFLDEHPDVGIVGSSFEELDGKDWPIAFRFPNVVSEISSGLQIGLFSRLVNRWEVPMRMGKSPRRVDWICGASMMIRPRVFSAVGGLDENYFLYFEETDFCYRAMQAGFSTWYVPQSRVMHIRGQSTNVTDRKPTPSRLPSYWFKSRTRYFAVTHGPALATLIDVFAVVSNCIGLAKKIILRKHNAATPHFIRDLIRHSVLWPRNRPIPLLNGGEVAERASRGIHSGKDRCIASGVRAEPSSRD